MAIAAGIGAPNEASVGTTLTRIDPGQGARYVYLSAAVDLYLVYSDSLDEGGVMPASARYRIPANVEHPAEVLGKRMLVGLLSGTALVSAIGVSG
jgi:hypothetical protein